MVDAEAGVLRLVAGNDGEAQRALGEHRVVEPQAGVEAQEAPLLALLPDGGPLLDAPRCWHERAERHLPEIPAQEVGQPQIELGRDGLLGIGVRHAEAQLDLLAPAKHVARAARGDAKLGGVPRDECRRLPAPLELDGVEPQGRPLRREGAFVGLAQVGAGEDVAPALTGRERQRDALPVGADPHALVVTAALELADRQAHRRRRRGRLGEDRQRVRLARLDLDVADVRRQRRPDRVAVEIEVVEV